ncbi:serine hydrolase domain-containing protein [Streptomyces sp. NPDC056387]|uniref:serine hydrolase domain-containing protein n=1 Tax=Streptomyces sp. NPDC056387 TaxID=3345803 RepID=UPI0035DE9E31
MTTTSSTARIEALLQTGVREEVYPGAVWAVGDADGIRASGAVGLLDPDRPDEPMRLDTVFDVASLTKILAVWSTIGTLVEEGKLDLHAPLGTFWEEVAGYPLARATAHHLLTHTAGLPLRANLKNLYGTDPQDFRDGVLHEALHRPPGVAVEYTDRAALVLGYLTENLSGRPLDRLATDRAPRPGADPAEEVWVHYGFTGTGMWISPAQGRWAVLLTDKLRLNRNRVRLTEIRNAFRATEFTSPARGACLKERVRP